VKGHNLNYPDWAPESLVNLHKLRLDSTHRAKRPNIPNPEEEVAEMRKDERYKSHTEEQFQKLKESMYRWRLELPFNESDELLLKLISDQRMKEVWFSLARRRKAERDEIHFWRACEGAVLGWRGEPKITQKERLQILTNIQESLESLQNNMHKLKDFQHYSINKLIDEQSVKFLLENLDAGLSQIDEEERVGYASFCLQEIVPPFDIVLMDIHAKAKEYMLDTVTVKKPNSGNAETHYFVRQLSSFFQRYFGQPLHESVAITASVVLNVDEIDSDYVRKLVKI
jgi:hypothetical protein